MRGKKAAINTILTLLEEVAAVVCGFILPRLILSAYGSVYNGLITSITQFLSCAVLLRSGIGGATRAALYKPLAENNVADFSSIVIATEKYMRKIGLILLGLIFSFAIIYSFFFRDQFGWLFTFTLILIIGASTFAESFFGITYLIVLQADQKLWISSVMKIVCYILNTVFAAILIIHGASIHAVKLLSAVVYVAYPIVLGIYVRKKYVIDRNVQANENVISQRWDAFWHQVSAFVMGNTDVMVLTVFSNMLEVSVYSVYNMVMLGLKRIITAFSNSLEAAFGNMIAKKQMDALRDSVSSVELILYDISTIIYTTTAIVIFDFVKLYTRNINDVNYIRFTFAFIIIISQFFNGIRLPYQMVVQAAGHYKQTRNGAIIEPIINISLSILFVIKFGLVGVAVGTLAATIFRTIQYSSYMRRHILHRSWTITFIRCIVSFAESAFVIFLAHCFLHFGSTTYANWIIESFCVFFISSIVVIFGSLVFFTSDVRLVMSKIKNIVSQKRK